MALATIYSLAPVKVASTVIPVATVGLSPGLIANLQHHSGQEFPTLVSVPGAIQRMTLSVPLAIAYATFGLAPISITTLEVFLAKYAALIKSTSTDHKRFKLTTSATAAALMTGWSVQKDGTAFADISIVFLAPAGTTNPITEDTATLITLASQPALHTNGPILINGTAIPGVQGYTVDLGQQLEVSRNDGDQYPTVAARITGQPKMTIEHGDPVGVLAAIGMGGANITANVVAYHRAYDPTTGVVSNTNSISVTCASGRAHPVDIAAQHGQIATGGIEIMGLATAAINPFVIAANATAP